MTPCTHGMPTPLACTECMADGNISPPPKHDRRRSNPVEARYPGRCTLCDDTIAVGDLIRISDGRTAHEGCANDHERTDT